jgi:hypothetical protein
MAGPGTPAFTEAERYYTNVNAGRAPTEDRGENNVSGTNEANGAGGGNSGTGGSGGGNSGVIP